jgi:hypothetical protein
MKSDIPAAHSMDTAWFAVDADGYVAIFATGEAGAMPVLAATHEAEGLDQLELAPATEPRREVLHEPDGDHIGAWQDEVTNVLYIVKSEQRFAGMLEAGTAKRLGATEGVGVYCERVTRTFHESLHTNDECLSCRWSWNGDESSVQLGLYDYDHTTENWIAGPYRRRAVPSRPLRVEDLPEPLRSTLKRARFDKLRFADTPLIQPCKFLESTAWGDRWLDDEGVERAMDDNRVLERDEDGDE